MLNDVAIGGSLAGDFSERLALGTAQFGLNYGINNTAGRPSDATLQAILQTARAGGITLLDTAAAYGDSETRLGKWLSQQEATTTPFRLVTKLAAGPAAQVHQQLRKSLSRLCQPSVYGALFHAFKPFREQAAAWPALQQLRAAGLLQHIGVSLYHPEEAEWLLTQQYDIDLVQVPFNVFDQRFGPLLLELQRRGVEVHVRSAFLQGLLLRNPATLPAFFAPLSAKITRLHILAQEANVPLTAMLLVFAALTPGVNRVVIGVDSAAYLRDNLAAAAHLRAVELLRPALQDLAESTDTYLLPYTWPPRP